jgi:hypothetical protein
VLLSPLTFSVPVATETEPALSNGTAMDAPSVAFTLTVLSFKKRGAFEELPLVIVL